MDRFQAHFGKSPVKMIMTLYMWVVISEVPNIIHVLQFVPMPSGSDKSKPVRLHPELSNWMQNLSTGTVERRGLNLLSC